MAINNYVTDVYVNMVNKTILLLLLLSEANNKYMEEYDDSQPSKYLFYIDANNLYGWAMSKPLPYDKLEWVEDLDTIKIMELKEDDKIGYILEVDLEYPDELHDEHNEFPFCPENIIPPGGRDKKLCGTFYNKQKYVIHYMALQQALYHGVKLVKIHRAVQFRQEAWLKPFIDLNTEMRGGARSEFERGFYKLMANSIYGKTMENVRRRIDIRISREGRQLEKLMAKPNFEDRTKFGRNLVAVHMKKIEILFDKPIYLGLTVLDLSKTHMYAFHYDVMRPFYEHNVQILYTDTDSFLLDHHP